MRLLLPFLVGACSAIVRAQTIPSETYDYNQNVADLGRGGVHNIDPTVGSSFLANPAVLAFVKGFQWSILDIQAGVDGASVYNTYTQHPISTANLPYYFGQNVWLGGAGYSALAVPNFGVAAYGSTYTDFILHDPAYPTMNLEGYLDYGFVVGSAMQLNENFALGLNVKHITRQGSQTTLGPSTLLTGTLGSGTLTNLLAVAGSGYGMDLGALYKATSTFNPTVSLAWKDVGWTTFAPNAGQTGPPPIEDNLVLGVTVGQSVLGVGWLAGFEFRHMLNWDVDSSKKFNFGTELNLALIDLRAGLYEGYMTYGASVDLWILTIDAAQYTVERGIFAGEIADQRYQVGVRMEASLDPNFILQDIGGKNHRLKQRR